MRAAVGGLAVLALLGAAVVAGVRWADARADATAAAGPVPVRAVQPTPEDWAAVLRELDLRRSAAFARGRPDGLAQVYAAGSAVLRRDAAALAQLSARRLRAYGLRLEVRRAKAAQAGPGRVVLQVVDRLTAYDLVDRSGRVVRRQAGRGERAWAVLLVSAPGVPGEWRIAAITPVS